jgi:hypothetical protein
VAVGEEERSSDLACNEVIANAATKIMERWFISFISRKIILVACRFGIRVLNFILYSI